jgi:hypothetical protein
LSEPLYIWITRWEEFQHYAPRRDRGPAWIKTYTAQLDDDRYLSLSNAERSLLVDLRLMFASMRGRVPFDVRSLSARRRQRTLNASLERLNRAGLVEFISRDTLDQRLERLYASRAPAPSQEVEVEVEVEKEKPKAVSESRNEDATFSDGTPIPNQEPELPDNQPPADLPTLLPQLKAM